MFVVAALACAFAPTVEVLVAARIVQGLGAALSTPQVLATIQATARGAARTRAIAAFGASGGTGAAVGQVAGGMLAGATVGGVSGWRLVFVLLAVLAAAAIALSSRAPHAGSRERVVIDVVGTGMLGLGILGLSVALTLGPTAGWSWPVVVGVLVGAGSFVVLWRHQRALEDSGRVPLLPPRVLRVRVLQHGLLAAGAFFAGYSALLFVFPRAVAAAGLSPMQCALALLPFAVVFGSVSLAVARVQARLGEATLLWGVGVQVVALAGMGLTVAVAWGPDIGIWLQPSLLLLAGARALIYAPLTQLVVREVPEAAAGLSGGMFGTVQQLALSFGVLLMGGLSTMTGLTGRGELAVAVVLEVVLGAVLLALAVLLCGPRLTRRR